VQYLDRGYEGFERKLESVGAKIWRASGQKVSSVLSAAEGGSAVPINAIATLE
jgi:hypothetical protein